jgi:hypothetical protein
VAVKRSTDGELGSSVPGFAQGCVLPARDFC